MLRAVAVKIAAPAACQMVSVATTPWHAPSGTPQNRPVLLCAVLLVIGFVIQYECMLAAIQHSSPRHAQSAAFCHVANRNASAFHSSNFNSFQVACSALPTAGNHFAFHKTLTYCCLWQRCVSIKNCLTNQFTRPDVKPIKKVASLKQQ